MFDCVTWVSDVGCRVFGRWEGNEHHGDVPQHLLSAQRKVAFHSWHTKKVHSFSLIQTLNVCRKIRTLKTYSESKSLSLYIQKLVETMPSSSLDPSRPTKTKKEPIPWRTLPNNDWTSVVETKFQETEWRKKSAKMVSDCCILPGLSWISLGRNFWKVLKIPALEMMTGARTAISSCPFSTVTPGSIDLKLTPQ